MIQAKYTNPFLMDDGEEKPKDDKQEQMGGAMMKKMEQLFLKNVLFIYGAL